MTLPNTRRLRISAGLLVLMAVGGCLGSAETEHLYYSTAMGGRTFGFQEAILLGKFYEMPRPTAQEF